MDDKKMVLLIFVPFILSAAAAYFQILILVPFIIFIIFAIVAVLPFAHGHENLWLFLIGVFSFLPLNLFLLREYPIWREYLCGLEDVKLFIVMGTIEAVMILTSVEEVTIGFFGRLIWRRQYKLNIPEVPEEM